VREVRLQQPIPAALAPRGLSLCVSCFLGAACAWAGADLGRWPAALLGLRVSCGRAPLWLDLPCDGDAAS
jgi:hypothetical protein